jgi:hypothetical protein
MARNKPSYEAPEEGTGDPDPSESRPNAGKDPFANGEEPTRQLRILTGKSIIGFAERKIDLSQNLLGLRWLSRRMGGFIVAPSGHGKSSLIIQAAICWSCGRAAFGIEPATPLRILIIQAEDDDNDVTEMAMMRDRLQLTKEETELVRHKTHIEWVNDVTGKAFFVALDDFLTQFPADLIFINPYTAYQGGDLRNDELNNEFLRSDLTRVMNAHKCGAIPVHHTPKTNFQNTDQYSWFDWMYSMAGGASLTNWARSILVIAPTDIPGTYRFIAAKRFEKIGWCDREYWYAHSVEGGKILWVPASQEQINLAKEASALTSADILCHVPKLDAISQDRFFQLCKEKTKAGEKKVRRFINILIEENKAYEWKLPRPGKKSAIGYSQSKQANDGEEEGDRGD